MTLIKGCLTMGKNSENTILTGSLWKGILFFALPMAFTNILHQLFNSVDVAVVGRFCGSMALAAVGSTGTIVNLYITIFSGLALGVNVVFSRMIGEGDESGLERNIPLALLISLISGMIFLLIGVIFSKMLLTVMGTPEDILGRADLYLRIYMMGSVFRMVYQFGAAILRAKGDTKRPMICLMITGIINVLLNLFFVLVLQMEVSGVAIATVISDAISMMMLIMMIKKDYPGLKPGVPQDFKLLFAILNNGIPAALQGMLFNVANIIIQTGINSLGSTAVAATTVALNMEVFAYYMIMGFANASMTWNSQNMGAGNYKRCRQATRWSFLLGIVFVYLMCLCFVIFRFSLAGLYTSDNAVIELAARRILILQLLEGINLCTEVFASTIRGRGIPYLPTVLTVIFTCMLRVSWMLFVFPKWHVYDALITIYLVSWSITALSMVIAYILINKKITLLDGI